MKILLISALLLVSFSSFGKSRFGADKFDIDKEKLISLINLKMTKPLTQPDADYRYGFSISYDEKIDVNTTKMQLTETHLKILDVDKKELAAIIQLVTYSTGKRSVWVNVTKEGISNIDIVKEKIPTSLVTFYGQNGSKSNPSDLATY